MNLSTDNGTAWVVKDAKVRSFFWDICQYFEWVAAILSEGGLPAHGYQANCVLRQKCIDVRNLIF